MNSDTKGMTRAILSINRLFRKSLQRQYERQHHVIMLREWRVAPYISLRTPTPLPPTPATRATSCGRCSDAVYRHLCSTPLSFGSPKRVISFRGYPLYRGYAHYTRGVIPFRISFGGYIPFTPLEVIRFRGYPLQGLSPLGYHLGNIPFRGYSL